MTRADLSGNGEYDSEGGKKAENSAVDRRVEQERRTRTGPVTNRRAGFSRLRPKQPGIVRPSILWDLDGVGPLFYMAILRCGLDRWFLELKTRDFGMERGAVRRQIHS